MVATRGKRRGVLLTVSSGAVVVAVVEDLELMRFEFVVAAAASVPVTVYVVGLNLRDVDHWEYSQHKLSSVFYVRLVAEGMSVDLVKVSLVWVRSWLI